MESTGGDWPREALGEDELGTGRGLAGEAVFLGAAIEPECTASPRHILCDTAKVY